jgi:hypothetical protein
MVSSSNISQYVSANVKLVGTVTLSTDFPTLQQVVTGVSQYLVLASVIDNNPTSTNTGQSFTAGQYIIWDNGTWAAFSTGSSSGGVTSVSVVSANGLAGTVANATTTPAITLSTTITGILKGNGTSISAATAGTDYIAPDSNNNITANNFFSGFTSVAASVTLITLTAASTPNYLITGSGGQIIKLPDATTLPKGALFSFNNNQSSGAITVNNNSSTLIVSVPSGGYATVILLDNSIAAGSWDRHDEAPSNVSWSTNTLDYAGSITNATWNGNAIALNRGGTNANLTAVNGGAIYSTGSALAITAAGTSGQVLTSSGTGAPTWTTPTTGTVTSVTGTSPIASSGGATPAISISQATTSTNGYLSSTDWNTFNSKQPAGTYVTSVNATSPVTSSGGTTPTIAMPAATTSVSGYLTSTDWTTFNNKGSGTVTSVAVTVPSIFSVAGSPIASSGTIALTYSGTALPILNGGTGQTTASAAFNALSPITTTGDLIIGNGTNSATNLSIGTSSYVLTSNGTTASWAATVNSFNTRTGTITLTSSDVTSALGYTPANITKFNGQSGAITATATSGIVIYEFTGSGSLTLPTAVSNNAIFMVKNRYTANITVTFTSGQNADGSTSIAITPYQALQFISNNSNYNIF